MFNVGALQIGDRFNVEYFDSGFAIVALKQAVLAGTRDGPDGIEYEFEIEMPVARRVVTVRADLIVRVEPT
jgi:hypothetical protein